MTKTKDQRPKTITIIFAVLIVVAYFIGLGALPLLGPDEPRYAQVAREMFERGDLITPTLGGFHWFEKPALAYWLMIAGYKLFGVSEFSARFGSALFGLLTVLTIYLLCKFASENTEEHREKTGFAFWALLVSASSIGLMVFSHAATFDIILTFPITAALACFFIFDSTQNPPATAGGSDISASPRLSVSASLFGFYFFIGLALLAKGLIGAVLPFGIVFWYFVVLRKLPTKTFLLSLLWGGLVTCAVAATWYLPMYLRHGWEFIDEFFIQHHFARYTSNKYAHPEPFWFFWAVLPGLTLPWIPFLIAAIWKLVSRKGAKTQSKENAPLHLFTSSPLQDLRIFALVWLIVPLLFFSFSGSKLPGYILPALSAALILSGEQVWLFVGNNRRRFIMSAVPAVLMLIVSAFAPFFAQEFAQRDSAKFVRAAFTDSNGKVLNLHDIWHSLEFYAAGRLARTPEGKQIKFEGVGEIVEYLQKHNEQSALVVVPLEHEYQLKETNLLETRRIADNGAFALFAVTRK